MVAGLTKKLWVCGECVRGSLAICGEGVRGALGVCKEGVGGALGACGEGARGARAPTIDWRTDGWLQHRRRVSGGEVGLPVNQEGDAEYIVFYFLF